MDFTLPEELRMLRDTVARYVKQELIPLEREVIRREAERGLTDAPLIPPDAEKELARKAKEIGLDLATLPEPGTPGRANNAPFGNAPPNTSPSAPADWNPRFVGGRLTRAFEFMQNQRRRMVLVAKWGEYMKDLDLFIGSPTADVAPNAQTGHPCAVFPYKFDVPQFGAAAPRPADTTTPAPPPPQYKAQPMCAVITGNLFNDDKILSVAHQFQKATDFPLRRPIL